MFPPELATIENPELRALLYELDFTPNTTRGSAVSKCVDSSERMNFVVDFFRTYQQDKSLLQAPFTDPQVESGRRPINGARGRTGGRAGRSTTCRSCQWP